MLERFNSPAKRVGLLALAFGTLSLLLAFLPFLEVTQYNSSPMEAFIDHLKYGPFHAWRTWGSWARSGAAFAAWIGLILLVGGGLFAFGYDAIIAPFVRWILTGRTRPPG